MLSPQTSTLPKDPLFSKLLDFANQRDDQVIIDDRSRGTRSSYRQVLEGTVQTREKLREFLDSSVPQKPGDFYIALLAPNGYEFIVGVLAVLALGGVVVPIPTGALPAEASFIIQQCSACCILVDSEFVGLAAQICQEAAIQSLLISSQIDESKNLTPATSYTLDPDLSVSEDCPSILFFTSGTTGPPKGVLHARRTINKYAHTDQPEPSDEMLLSGVRVEIQNFGRNYNLIWEKFRDRTGTKIVLSPTFWHGMMKHYQDHISKLPEAIVRDYVEGFQYVRDACATGAMPSSRVKEFWQSLRDGQPLKVLYGSTETQEISVFDERAGSSEADLGTLLPNVVLKLSEGDEGEILVKTPSLFLGYLNSPAATADRFDDEGFFKTGDLAVRHNGRYIFKGRANLDLFKFYTYKVPRLHVENYLVALPYISEGYIMPVIDPQCDTRVAALVRFHDGRGDLNLDTLRNDLSKDLPAYQLPTVLRVLKQDETVPRTWSDKTAMLRAIQKFFPQDSEERLCGDAIEILDISQFMKMETTKMWDLSGIR